MKKTWGSTISSIIRESLMNSSGSTFNYKLYQKGDFLALKGKEGLSSKSKVEVGLTEEGPES